MPEFKQLRLEELHVNMKVRIRSLEDETGFVMIIHCINGTTVTAAKKHSGPIGGRFTTFEFYSKGVMYVDGTGRCLIVERLR